MLALVGAVKILDMLGKVKISTVLKCKPFPKKYNHVILKISEQCSKFTI